MSVSVDLTRRFDGLRLVRWRCVVPPRPPASSIARVFPAYGISANVSRRLLELERIALWRLRTYSPRPSSAVAEPVLGQERPRARACPELSAAVRRLNRDLVSGDAGELCLQGASSGSGLFWRRALKYCGRFDVHRMPWLARLGPRNPQEGPPAPRHRRSEGAGRSDSPLTHSCKAAFERKDCL